MRIIIKNYFKSSLIERKTEIDRDREREIKREGNSDGKSELLHWDALLSIFILQSSRYNLPKVLVDA